MDSKTIFHDHNGKIVELEGDSWPIENTGLIEPTDEQLNEEKERDFEEFFFQYTCNSTDPDTHTETTVLVNVEKDTVFCPSVSDTILIEDVVPGNDNIAMFTNYTCTTSIAEPTTTPTD